VIKTIILPLVVYLCEPPSLTPSEEHILRVFEIRMLREIFVPKREEVAGGWRRLRNEELHNLYTSQNIIRANKSRTMRWAVHVARMGDIKNAHNILVGKPDVKRPLGRPRRRWEDNITRRMVLKK
jgi:hypothetical protein